MRVRYTREIANYPDMYLDFSNPFKPVMSEMYNELASVDEDGIRSYRHPRYMERVGELARELEAGARIVKKEAIPVRESKVTKNGESSIRIDWETHESYRITKEWKSDRRARKLIGQPRVTKSEMKRLKTNYDPVPKKYYYGNDYPWRAPVFTPKIERLSKEKRERYEQRLGDLRGSSLKELLWDMIKAPSETTSQQNFEQV